MKSFTLLIFSSFFGLLVSAQSRVQHGKGASATPQKKASSTAQPLEKKVSPAASSTQPVPIKDKIEQRLRDSADDGGSGSKPNPAASVINGIRVPAPGTSPATPVVNGAADPANIQNNAQSTYTNAPVLTGSVLPATSAGINGSTTGNRPVSGEQSQYNTSDLNRNQMNVVNQNQNASSPQNNTATMLNQNTVGNNQWGQNQVGENQWSPPPAIIRSGFGRDFPAIQNATWSTDASRNYIARYKVGDWWTTTAYNTAGIRLETRTEFPVSAQYPSPVIMYREKITTPMEFSRISRIERQGKNTVFELRLNNGRVVYINNEGLEVPFEQ